MYIKMYNKIKYLFKNVIFQKASHVYLKYEKLKLPFKVCWLFPTFVVILYII